MTAMYKWRADGTNIPAFVVKEALDSEGCDNLIRELKDTTATATHIETRNDKNEATANDKSVRDSTITWFNDTNLSNVLLGYVMTANYEAGWRYDITDREQLQFTVYKGEEKQHYGWHTDGQGDHFSARQSSHFHRKAGKDLNLLYTPQANLLGTVRKISVSAILNDGYEGGELCFQTIGDDNGIEYSEIKGKKGDVIIFPSYMCHRVKPITKGTRYSVVAWYGGPPFK